MAQQNPGGLKRVFAKAKIIQVEQTPMSAEFVKNTEHYDKYKDALDVLADRMQLVVQSNPTVLTTPQIECAPGENPHEKLVASLSIFITYFPGDKTAELKEMIEENKKLATIEREYQLKARRAIKHIRRFTPEEYIKFADERQKFNKARETMDLVKHELKNAKTTEQVEKKGVLYEQAVAEFDAQAKQVVEIVSRLPQIQESHVKDVLDYFDVLTNFHRTMSKVIVRRE